jgi:hypothetical protein
MKRKDIGEKKNGYKDSWGVDEDCRGVWPAQGGLVVKASVLSPRQSSSQQIRISRNAQDVR